MLRDGDNQSWNLTGVFSEISVMGHGLEVIGIVNAVILMLVQVLNSNEASGDAMERIA